MNNLNNRLEISNNENNLNKINIKQMEILINKLKQEIENYNLIQDSKTIDDHEIKNSQNSVDKQLIEELNLRLESSFNEVIHIFIYI
jgi:hypothetical protein